MSLVDVMVMTDEELRNCWTWHVKRRKELLELMSDMLANGKKDNGEFKMALEEQSQIIAEERLLRENIERRRQYK